jgi:hypothetical protein
MAADVHDLEQAGPALGGQRDEAGAEGMCAELIAVQPDPPSIFLDDFGNGPGAEWHGQHAVVAIDGPEPSLSRCSHWQIPTFGTFSTRCKRLLPKMLRVMAEFEFGSRPIPATWLAALGCPS